MSSLEALTSQLAALTNLVQHQATQYENVMNQMEDLRRSLQDVNDRDQERDARPAASSAHVGEPVFAAKRIKLDLPPFFTGKPSELAGWLFKVEQYCKVVGITSPTDMVCLAVSRLDKEAFVWWRQLTNKSADYELGHLLWQDFRSHIEDAFQDIDCELKLRRRLATLKQTKSVALYVKEFRNIVIELGSQAPDDSALIFMFTEGLKPEVQLQVMLARPTLLSEAEQIAERADMAIFAQQRRSGNQGYQQPYKFKGKHPQQQQRSYMPRRQQQDNGPVPMDLGTMATDLRNGKEHGAQKVRRAIKCYRCGQEGHIKRHCRNPPLLRPALNVVDALPTTSEGPKN